MKKLLIKALLFSWVGIAALNSHAQDNSTPEFVYRVWNNQNGLPQNTVYEIIQDSIGYLWGATEEGLFRFDGARFHVISNENTPGLQSNNFYSVRGHGSRVWATTRNAVLRIRNEVEKLYDFSDKVGGGWIKCMEIDEEGTVWVGTSGGLLYQIRDDSVYLFREGAPLYRSVEILRETSAGMLLGSPQGLFILKKEDTAFKPVSSVSGVLITSLAPDAEGNIWVGTATQGLIRIAAGDINQVTPIEGLREKFINTLRFDGDGRLWIGFRSSGYSILDRGRLLNPEQDKVGHDGIRSIIVINPNRAWLGTTSSGLVQLRSALINQLPDSIKAVVPIALGIYQDDDDEIWVGTAGRGVNRIKDGKATLYSTENGLSGNLVLTITSRGQFVYVGTAGGLDRFNKKLNRFDRHYTESSGLRTNGIISLFHDSKDRIWIATRLGGLNILTPDDKIESFDLPTSLLHVNILGFMEHSDGSVWIGSRGAGVIRVLPDKRVQHFHTHTGFPSDIAYAFFQDEDGDIWMSSEKGLVVYRNGQFRLFGREAGLHFNESYRIMQDSRHHIWISGNLGLQRIAWSELKRAKESDKPVRMAVRLFNEFDGMPNSEANGGFYPAGWPMKDGTLWFPTIGGVSIVDPNIVTRDEKQLDIHVQMLQFADKRFYPGEDIRLPAGVYNFEIRYASIDFSSASDIQYSFRLKGLDNNWTEAGNRQVAYFSALPPGHYTFEVRSHLYGDQSPIRTVSFYVAPYFYQTIWFKLLLGAAILGLAAGIIIYFRRLAQRRLREQHLIIRAQMEGQEKERQVISAELHDSINQQLSTAKIYLDYAKANENEREELIGRSADVVTRAIQEIRALCYSLTPVGLKDMGLEEAVEDLCLSYSSVGKLKTEYHYGLKGVSLTEDLQFVLYRVIQEQMNNIARHAEAEYVRIELDYEAGNFMVLISDDGKGFDPATVKEGLGFANMRNRLSVYKGKLEVDTAPGQGCRLLVKIPRK